MRSEPSLRSPFLKSEGWRTERSFEWFCEFLSRLGKFPEGDFEAMLTLESSWGFEELVCLDCSSFGVGLVG